MRARFPHLALGTLAWLTWATCPASPGAGDEEPLAHLFASYIGNSLTNLDGGLREGSAYLDYVELAAGFDLGRALGRGNVTAYVSAFGRNGATFSDRHVGESMVVSNIDASNPMELLETWVELGFDAGGPASLRLGLYDLSSEFDVLESRALFLNSAYGTGQDLAQTGMNGPSLYPVTALGARFAWTPRAGWLLQSAVLDGVPGDPAQRGRSRLHLSSSEGALWITEAKAGNDRVRGGAGYWRYTAAFPGLQPPDATTPATARSDNAGSYVMAEFASAASERSDGPRWLAFVRAGTAEDRCNVFDRFLAAGAVYHSAWPGRYGSHLGLAVAEARVGDTYRGVRAADGLATDAAERNIELTWRLRLGEHAALQPDLQYVQNPSGDPQIADAWIVGLRLELFLAR